MILADPSRLLDCKRQIAAIFAPAERYKLSDWAEKNIVLSSEYSAKSSELRLYGWQREILDAFTDPAVEEMVCMTAVQMIKSLAIQCAIAYVVVEDPGPILMLLPKEDACMAFTKRRLGPMVRDCKCLHGKISESVHDGKSTLLSKNFPGGNLLLVSANTPTDVAQHTIRYVFCDEPDKYPKSAGKEGDSMDLAWERASTFGSRRKRIQSCSPTIKGESRIGKAYESSDQRKPWVPCPKCGTKQILVWAQVKNEDGGSFVIGGGKNARYECINADCQARWTDVERWAACELAEWRAEKPFNGVAGFWISHLYSPWKKLPQIVKHFLTVKDDRMRLQVFINTVLAEQWQDAGETPDAEKLYARREHYPFGDQEGAVVPQRGLFLTAAVDVQDNPPRLEVETKAWGRGRENWSIDYRVIQCFAPNGQPLPVTSRELWDKLDAEVLQRSWRHESGHYLPIWVMGIDTGSRPKPVYEFARRHSQLAYGPAGLKFHTVRTVVPVKGTPDPLKIVSSVSKEDAARKRQGVRIVGIGTHAAKQEIYDVLQHVVRVEDGTLSGKAVPGCCHFPMYDMSYFDSLTAEVRVEKENGDIVWEKRGARNEVLDDAVYNRGMAAIVGIDRFTEAQWQQLERAVSPISVPVAAPEPVVAQSQGQTAQRQQSVPPLMPVPQRLAAVRQTRGGFV